MPSSSQPSRRQPSRSQPSRRPKWLGLGSVLCLVTVACCVPAAAERPPAQPHLDDGAAREILQLTFAAGKRCGGQCRSEANPTGCPCDSSCACLDQAAADGGRSARARANTGEPRPLTERPPRTNTTFTAQGPNTQAPRPPLPRALPQAPPCPRSTAGPGAALETRHRCAAAAGHLCPWAGVPPLGASALGPGPCCLDARPAAYPRRSTAPTTNPARTLSHPLPHPHHPSQASWHPPHSCRLPQRCAACAAAPLLRMRARWNG
jgi:hypothetical protein